LKDSNVNPKLETVEEQGVRAAPWLAAFRRVEGLVRAPRWDLEEFDKLQLLTQTCTKLTWGV
jgi:hypothetical protein